MNQELSSHSYSFWTFATPYRSAFRAFTTVTIVGMLGLGCVSVVRSQDSSPICPAGATSAIAIHPLTTVVETPPSGYFSDPYPMHLANEIKPQLFSGTTAELLACPEHIHANCIDAATVTVSAGPLVQQAEAEGSQITVSINHNVYQDNSGIWQMAVTFYVQKPGSPDVTPWTVIAHAHPVNPAVPTDWIADSLLVGSLNESVDANYDGKFFEDNGKLYLIYSKELSITPHHDGIVAQRMISASQIAPVDSVVLLQPEDVDGGYNSEYFYGLSSSGQPTANTFKLIETGNITKIGGKYAMAYSTGAYDLPGYKAGVAWSDTFLPLPGSSYKRVLKEDPTGVWGQPNHLEVRYLLQSQRSAWPNYVASQVLAPGVPSFVQDSDGQWRLYFAGYDPSDPTIHQGSNPNGFAPDRRRPYFVRLKIDIPDGATVLTTSGLDLVGWLSPVSHCDVPTPPTPGAISVSGTHFLRDGVVWAPHGLNSFAFNAAPSVRTGLFGVAYNNFNPTELAAMKAWGADTIRFFVSQPGLDPQAAAYDPAFLGEFVAGVTAARSIGLNAIVCVQDEAGSGEMTPTMLPDAGTGRAWQALAPALKGDNGILFEIMNEPQPKPSAADWSAWSITMNAMVRIIRNSGATNVLIADGLSFAEQLDGAPMLADPLHQVAYASHPYAHSAADQTPAAWDMKFGNVSVTSVAPVLVSEWSLENDIDAPPPNNTFQYCDANSNMAGLNMLNYLQGKGIGLLAIAYDLPNNPSVPRDGRATINEQATPSTLVNTGCADATFGPGTIIQNWYRTGVVPASLE